jgi:hypothetical protein
LESVLVEDGLDGMMLTLLVSKPGQAGTKMKSNHEEHKDKN